MPELTAKATVAIDLSTSLVDGRPNTELPRDRGLSPMLEAGEFETVAAPFRMHNSPDVGVRGPAPRAGEHTAALLSDLLGLDESEIADLTNRGVVATD